MQLNMMLLLLRIHYVRHYYWHALSRSCITQCNTILMVNYCSQPIMLNADCIDATRTPQHAMQASQG
jgi:hypothetical protein